MYPWFKPLDIKNLLKGNILKAINNNKMTMSDKTILLEKKIAKMLNVKFVILTTSGTSALMMATIASDLKPGDFVISPNLTWIATVNPSIIIGAKIKLIDSLPCSEKVNFDELNKNIIKFKPKLVLLPHLNGQVNYDKKFEFLKKKLNFFVIEDAAQAFLCKGKYKYYCGTRYNIGCFSLSITKPINMIYGGFCCTNNKTIAKKLISIRNNGILNSNIYNDYERASTKGLNLKPSDLHSVIGLEYLKKAKLIKEKLIEIYQFYKKNINNRYLKFAEINENEDIPCYPQIFVKEKRVFYKFCKKRGIQLHLGFRCLSEIKYLKLQKSGLNNSKLVSKLLVRLPCGPGYVIRDLKKIVKIINSFKKYN